MSNNLKEMELLSYNKNVANEAKVIISHALLLSKAFESGNKEELLYALDSNLTLWVEIETSVLSKENTLPKNIKTDLLKLCKFVERMIISKGVSITKEDLNSIISANTEVSNGLLEQANNVNAFENAVALLHNALEISSAKERKDDAALVTALDENMRFWLYIKTMAAKESNTYSKEIKSNLIKLADYVSAKTFEVGKNLNKENSSAIDSMVITNLQVSEGLISNSFAA